MLVIPSGHGRLIVSVHEEDDSPEDLTQFTVTPEQADRLRVELGHALLMAKLEEVESD